MSCLWGLLSQDQSRGEASPVSCAYKLGPSPAFQAVLGALWGWHGWPEPRVQDSSVGDSVGELRAEGRGELSYHQKNSPW